MIYTIKDALIDAKRYEHVISILQHITELWSSVIAKNVLSYPITPFIHIDGKDILNEAKEVIQLITENGDTNKYFTNLQKYVNTEVNIMLHNFANDISLRKHPTVGLNEIRKWQTLLHIINCLDHCDDDGRIDFTVPEGWRK